LARHSGKKHVEWPGDERCPKTARRVAFGINTPLSIEMATNADDKALIELFDTLLEMGRPYALPPQVPAERVRAFRRGFDQMVKDKDFVAEVTKQSLELVYMDGTYRA
jgi:hypothetical protein